MTNTQITMDRDTDSTAECPVFTKLENILYSCYAWAALQIVAAADDADPPTDSCRWCLNSNSAFTAQQRLLIDRHGRFARDRVSETLVQSCFQQAFQHVQPPLNPIYSLKFLCQDWRETQFRYTDHWDDTVAEIMNHPHQRLAKELLVLDMDHRQ